MDKKPQMGPDDVEIAERTSPFEGYFRIDKYRLRHRLFAGGMGPEISREIFERGHAAAVLLYDPDLDRLVFIEQFRAGAYAVRTSPWFPDDTSPWLYEIVAGIIDEGEDPEQVVRREAVEEAGCQVREMEFICHYLVTPGGSTESMFVYCGRVDASDVGGIHGLEEEGEDIRVFTLTPEEAYAALDDGRICNSMTIIPLQWFRLNHARLQAQWRTPE